MTITQSTDTFGINWQSFNIGAKETVIFLQPSATSIALNRVIGKTSSNIYGQLIANGKVFLVNPNGILFAPTAQVNVGSLVASMLNITNSDLLAGKYTFTGTKGSVTNQGNITAADGGYVILLGNQVANQGVIVANLGTVALGAGNAITMDVVGDGLVNLAVNQAAVNASVANGGTLQADGGKVIMTNQTADILTGTVVNNSGIIQAKNISINADGDVSLNGSVNMKSPNSNLNVSANRDININTAINAGSDNAAVTLQADNTGSSTGTVTFGSGSAIIQSSTGTTTIYYNPSSYVTPTDYSGKVSVGSLTAYMLVNNVTQLQNINTNLAGTYALGKDIDASATKDWNTGAGFATIGDYYNPFSGTMNGDGHVINNLYINRTGFKYASLFGGLTGTITNIGLTNESLTGGDQVGGLVGANKNRQKNTKKVYLFIVSA
ncbi:MAG: hxuA 1 [Firmicutes bacterium]|nr:hxuA 1 [Bacillota bacterium]